MIPIQCMGCGGLSQIEQAWLGQQVACPHCGEPTVAVAASLATPNVPPPPPPHTMRAPPPFVAPSAPPPPPAPIIHAAPPEAQAPELAEPAEPKPQPPPLTRAQREAIRSRRHLILALGGAVILLITAIVLFTLSTPLDD